MADDKQIRISEQSGQMQRLDDALKNKTTETSKDMDKCIEL